MRLTGLSCSIANMRLMSKQPTVAKLLSMGGPSGYEVLGVENSQQEEMMSTATTTLTRVKFEPNLDYKPSAMTLDLAERAQKRLGYSALSQCIGQASAKVNKEAQVLAALTKVGCDPLNPKKVEAYKEERLKVLNKGKDPNREPIFYWDTSELRYYNSPVPEFALSRALELSEALPGASFYVEHTTDAHPDPFMVMAYQGMKFYVDVWDEPSFEGRRTV